MAVDKLNCKTEIAGTVSQDLMRLQEWREHLRARSSSALMLPPLPPLASRAACHVPRTAQFSTRLGSSQHA